MPEADELEVALPKVWISRISYLVDDIVQMMCHAVEQLATGCNLLGRVGLCGVLLATA